MEVNQEMPWVFRQLSEQKQAIFIPRSELEADWQAINLSSAGEQQVASAGARKGDRNNLWFWAWKGHIPLQKNKKKSNLISMTFFSVIPKCLSLNKLIGFLIALKAEMGIIIQTHLWKSIGNVSAHARKTYVTSKFYF